ncbi:hypothetical protein MMC18_005014 [Xylographa bjoerkii]|nr:hypothetical protein [Xylographa bjoerkii]
MPVMETDGNGEQIDLEALLRSLRKPETGASSLARRPDVIMAARASALGVEAPERPERRHVLIENTFARNIPLGLATGGNAEPVSTKRAYDVEPVTISAQTIMINRPFQYSTMPHDRVNIRGRTSKKAPKSGDIFDLPVSEPDHKRTHRTSWSTSPRLSWKEAEASALVFTERQARRKQDVRAVMKDKRKKRRLRTDQLHMTTIPPSSTAPEIAPLQREKSIISISSDDESVSSSSAEKERRKRQSTSVAKSQCDIVKPVSTHRAGLQRPKAPEIYHFRVPRPTSNIPQSQVGRMRGGFDDSTDAQFLPNGSETMRSSRPPRLELIHTTQMMHEPGIEACLPQARELLLANDDEDCLSQPRLPSLHEPSLEKYVEVSMRNRGHNQTREECLEPRPQGFVNEDLIDALTREMRTPTSSIYDGYLSGRSGGVRVESGLGTRQENQLTAQMRAEKPQRRTSQAILPHKVMPQGYYEAISQHVRQPVVAPLKPLPPAGAGRAAESSDMANNESESSDQEESESASSKDFQISDRTASELQNASSAVQRIIRRMSKVVRKMSNDEY